MEFSVLMDQPRFFFFNFTLYFIIDFMTFRYSNRVVSFNLFLKLISRYNLLSVRLPGEQGK